MSVEIPINQIDVLRRTGCDHKIYRKVLGLSEDFSELTGKRVLDVAAGDGDTAYHVNEVLQLHGTQIHRVDIDYGKKAPEYKSFAKAGNALALPYNHGEFDEVWIVNFLYYSSIRPLEKRKAIKEALRVTGETGIIRIFPVYPKPSIMPIDRDEFTLYGGKVQIQRPKDTLFGQHTLVIDKHEGIDENVLFQILSTDIHFDPKVARQVSPY